MALLSSTLRRHAREWGECALSLAFPWPERDLEPPQRIEPPFCQRCGEPFPALPDKEAHLVCANCAPRRWHFRWARAGYRAEGEVLDAIVGFKYREEYYQHRRLIGWLTETFDRFAAGETWDALVPVPLYHRRRRERGFNQAAELANGLGKRCGVRVWDGLCRCRETLSQTGLDRVARWENMDGAFRRKGGFDLKGQNLLLIDDVFTTGATANACGDSQCVRPSACRSRCGPPGCPDRRPELSCRLLPTHFSSMSQPPPSDNIFPRPDYGKGHTRKKEMPEGLWTKCPECGAYIFNKELEANQMVCKECSHHFNIGALARLGHLLDEGSWEECDAGLGPKDMLKFVSTSAYADQLKRAQKKTSLQEGIICGLGRIEDRPVSVAVMEFNFIGGSMGSVVGEKITRAMERATKMGLPMLTFSASGGARMQEGLFSLMQMAKTSGALARHAAARLPFISILTNPTTGGVTASFASLGDLIFAEPKAMIAFAGARVLKETTRQDLPKGFQTAEFLLERGLVDRIVPRLQMRAELSKALDYLGTRAALSKSGRRNGRTAPSLGGTVTNGHANGS